MACYRQLLEQAFPPGGGKAMQLRLNRTMPFAVPVAKRNR
jgi:hypothetical protein